MRQTLAALAMIFFAYPPVERAGLKTGDTICLLVGQPVTQAPRGWASGTESATLQLDMCDGRTEPLTLVEFY